MDTWLWVALAVASVLYFAAGRLFVGRPPHEWPGMFFMYPALRHIAVALPPLALLAIVIAGFALTASGWWFLGVAVAVFLIFAVRPRAF